MRLVLGLRSHPDRDIFRLVDFPTVIVATERFAEAATRLGIEDLAFTELARALNATRGRDAGAVAAGLSHEGTTADAKPSTSTTYCLPWASLLARTFLVDILK